MQALRDRGGLAGVAGLLGRSESVRFLLCIGLTPCTDTHANRCAEDALWFNNPFTRLILRRDADVIGGEALVETATETPHPARRTRLAHAVRTREARDLFVLLANRDPRQQHPSTLSGKGSCGIAPTPGAT